MANLLVEVNMKRKDAEVASHGFSVFLDPKRAKIQDAEVSVMMEEEEEPLAGGDAPPANVHPTMSMPSPLVSLLTQGQEGAQNDLAEAMDVEVEVDLQQCPALKQQHAPFFSGFF